MKCNVRIVIAQFSFSVNDLIANAHKIEEACLQAKQQYQADMIVFPEMALCGYSPEDRFYQDDFYTALERAQTTLMQIEDIVIIVGLPLWVGPHLQNGLLVLLNGNILHQYTKCALPNYEVFDEKRYFIAGDDTQKKYFFYKGLSIGTAICEDLWCDTVAHTIITPTLDLCISINASPFHQDKEAERLTALKRAVSINNVPILYTNMVGAQDELIFDGHSFALDRNGNTVLQADGYKEALFCLEYNAKIGDFIHGYHTSVRTSEENIYAALKQGLQYYFKRNHFEGVILGLSGGIDSALTLAIAVDTLGAENVEAIMLPFHYTASDSIKAAREQADRLGVSFKILPITPVYDSIITLLSSDFQGYKNDSTEENIQARCRAIILMALANKKKYLLLNTGNKSENAVGYTTLYGDMAGGYAVLKDVYKTLVYRLASWRNTQNPIIPEWVIARKPSAELAPDQCDQDTLPSYDILDQILQHYIERKEGIETITQYGFDEALVRRIIHMVDASEHKRRQGAIGPKITSCAFGKDRRHPISL